MQPRTPPNRWTLALLAAAVAVGAASLADAQQKKPDKKLYCWDEGGHKVCGDALPASAAAAATAASLSSYSRVATAT